MEGETDRKKKVTLILLDISIKSSVIIYPQKILTSNTTLYTKKVMNILKIFTSIVEAIARKTP